MELLIKTTDAMQYRPIYKKSFDVCEFLEKPPSADSFLHMVWGGLNNSSEQNVLFTKCPMTSVSNFSILFSILIWKFFFSGNLPYTYINNNS